MGPIGKGTCAAIVVGAVAGAAWTTASFFTEWRLGFLAIVVGSAIGAAMASGSERRAGAMGGLLAAVVALVAMLGSRVMLTRLEVNAWTERMAEVSDEDAIDALASTAYEEKLARGESDDLLTMDGEYAPHLMHQAESAWSAMSAVEQEELKRALADDSRDAMAEASPFLMGLGLVFNIGLTGLIFMGCGVVTAWKLGCADAPSEATADVVAAPSRVSAVRAGRPEPVAAPDELSGPLTGPLRGPLKLPVDPLEGTAAGSLSLTSGDSQMRRAA